MNFQTTMMYDCDFAYMIRAWNQATLLRDNVTCDFWLRVRDTGAHAYLKHEETVPSNHRQSKNITVRNREPTTKRRTLIVSCKPMLI